MDGMRSVLERVDHSFAAACRSLHSRAAGLISHLAGVRPGIVATVAHALAHVRSHVQMLALLAASTAQVELTTKNFDKHVFGSGKSAFVKFLAPW